MGTFAGLYKKDGAGIQQEKKAEFEARLEKLFQAGGMMEVHMLQLYGKKVAVLAKAEMHDYGMDFSYNYFEEDSWESAGYNRDKAYVWSGKIGRQHFNRVMCAAYVLASFYTEGPAIADMDGEFLTSGMYAGWLNYLFDEDFPAHPIDSPWPLFEAMYTEGYEVEDDHYDWEAFMNSFHGITGYFDIMAVLNGTDAASEEVNKLSAAADVASAKEAGTGGSGNAGEADEKDAEGAEAQSGSGKTPFNFFNCIVKIKSAFEKYKEENPKTEEEQLSFIIKLLRTYYENGKFDLEAFDEEYRTHSITAIVIFVLVADAPAFTIKALAEVYGKDFWELWELVRDVAGTHQYNDSLLDTEDGVSKIPTSYFLKTSADDMIPFWEAGVSGSISGLEDEKLQFSDELKDWFKELKERFDSISGVPQAPQEKPLRNLIELMEYAWEEYRVLTFESFFEETIENLSDGRIMALWKLYDEMLHEEDGKKACGSDEEAASGEEDDEETETAAYRAEKLKRYMALAANTSLRKEVFGL